MNLNLNLSKESLKNVFSFQKHSDIKPPLILQVTNIKPVTIQNQIKKFRVLINDGVYLAHGLIDEQCLPYLENNNFARYAIVKVNDYTIFSTQKHIFLIKDIEILHANGGKVQPKDFINIDNYYMEHPQDDFLQLIKKSMENKKQEASEDMETRKINDNDNENVAEKKELNNIDQKPIGRITSIEALSPYQNKWIIKARVSYKGDLRTWSNTKGEGKLISLNFLDETDEIKATAFNEIAEKISLTVNEGKVYYITNARVQVSKKKFNNLPHLYELTLDKDTEITECFDTVNVPKINFNFLKLNKIKSFEVNSIIDVIGVLYFVGDLFQITAKTTGKTFDRRNITIVDDTNYSVDIALWNNIAINFNTLEKSIVSFKGCKIQDYNGRSLTLTQSGFMTVNPDVPNTYQLKNWFDNIGDEKNFENISVRNNEVDLFIHRKTILQILEENLGISDTPDYFYLKASIHYIKFETFCYPACPNQSSNNDTSFSEKKSSNGISCNKKLIEQSDGTYRCEKCDLSFNEPIWRYILNCSVVDLSGQIWLTLFDSEAKKLLKIDALELLKMKEQSEKNQGNDFFNEFLSNLKYMEYNFRIKARQDNYNDTIRVRYQAVSIDPINYVCECDILCKKLNSSLI